MFVNVIVADEPYIQHITQSLDLPDPVEVDRVLKEVFQEGLSFHNSCFVDLTSILKCSEFYYGNSAEHLL